MQKSLSISPNLKSKWTLEILEMEDGRKHYWISDGWIMDKPIVYDSGKVVYDFPERIPKYVKKFVQKAIGGKEWIKILYS